MHLIQLSKTHGLNLDHVVEWQDYPDLSTPWVSVVFSAPSEHETGQRQPHEARLVGTERETFLRWIAAEAVEAQHAADPTAFDTHAMMAEHHLQRLLDQWEGVSATAEGQHYLAPVADLAHKVVELRAATPAEA